MKYADASQARRESEEKEAEIGAESVAIMVESRAARKEPSQVPDITIRRARVEGSSGKETSSLLGSLWDSVEFVSTSCGGRPFSRRGLVSEGESVEEGSGDAIGILGTR